MKEIKLNIVEGNAFIVKGDVLVLKYAQALYGLDEDVVGELMDFEPDIASRLPAPSEYYFTDSNQVTNAKKLLFVGAPVLRNFRYREIREFSRKALSFLAVEAPDAKKILMTIHGANYGLDEIEAFESLLAGLVDSINENDYPASLQEIIFVEHSLGRAERLGAFLENIFPTRSILTRPTGGIEKLKEETTEILRSAGYASESKKKIFVAMPFADEFEDVFFFGIQGAVKNAGFLCERADSESFTGDIMDWVKTRIENSVLTIADLTGANPNVYLEVGYAWGKGKDTILLVRDSDELKFDVQGQRCLVYKNIKGLMEKLENELKNLKNNG